MYSRSQRCGEGVHGPPNPEREEGRKLRINKWVRDSQSDKVQIIYDCLCRTSLPSVTLSQRHVSSFK